MDFGASFHASPCKYMMLDFGSGNLGEVHLADDESLLGIVTTVSSSSWIAKLTFKGIRDLILGEDIWRRNSRESLGSLLSTESIYGKIEKGQNLWCGQSKSKKRG